MFPPRFASSLATRFASAFASRLTPRLASPSLAAPPASAAPSPIATGWLSGHSRLGRSTSRHGRDDSRLRRGISRDGRGEKGICADDISRSGLVDGNLVNRVVFPSQILPKLVLGGRNRPTAAIVGSAGVEGGVLFDEIAAADFLGSRFGFSNFRRRGWALGR